MKPKVAIIYLCHNDLRYVPEVVSSWVGLDYPKDQMTILMIPNGAEDGVQDLIRDQILPRSKKDLPEIILLDDGINHGFAGGNNLGINWASENDFAYVFLNNGDLRLDTQTISALVEVMESDDEIGSAQSLITLWHDEDIVNTTGGVIHVAGYGYARDNGKKLSEINIQDKEEIMYASGAAVIYRLAALKEVGLLEAGFFMYHEDLELGLRLRLAGYQNVLAVKSKAFHDYKFGRNQKMFAWMELYRWDVLLANLKVASLIVMSPLLLAIEFGVWLMAIKGGWFWSKLSACFNFWTVKNIKLIMDMRCRSFAVRKINDKAWLHFVSGRIDDQNQESALMNKINPIVDKIWQILRKAIV